MPIISIAQKEIPPAPPLPVSSAVTKRLIGKIRMAWIRYPNVPVTVRNSAAFPKMTARSGYSSPLARIQRAVRQKQDQAESERAMRQFLLHAMLWKVDRGPTSSPEELAMHPAYLRIIGMGRRVVPFIFRELAREPDHWFVALEALTNADPVPEEARGDLQKMANAWIHWGRNHGITGFDDK